MDVRVEDSEDSAASQAQEQALDAVSQRHILVINPDLEECRTTKEKLRNGIHRCKTYGAASGEEALAMIERIEVDCVVLSEFVKDFRDFELIGHLTNCTTLMPIPVVVLGETADRDVEQRALDAGAANFIGKSTGTAEMLCQSISNAIAHDRLMRVIELQNRQIQALSEERKNYVHRTDDLAHELLTPLAAIQEFVSLVFDGVAGSINEEQARHLAYARGGCDTIRTTVESLIVNRDLDRILSPEN